MRITLSEQLPTNEVRKCGNGCVEAAVVLGDAIHPSLLFAKVPKSLP
jgi:hypothetical protein